MRLSARKVANFHRDGFLFMPGLFSEEEAALLRRAALRFARPEEPYNFPEPDGKTVRTALGPHRRSRAYAKLVRHPRLIEPIKQLLGSEVYLHQCKVNCKAAFNGDVWDWHQDFATWYNEDGMPNPDAITVAVFLDEVTSMNGPLMIMPGSHKAGRLPASQDVESRSHPLWITDQKIIKRMADTHDIVVPTGPAGSVLFFHCNMVHASGSNMTPWNRMIAYLGLNVPDNFIRRFKRSGWIALRDFSPITCLPDDCLENKKSL